MCALYAGSDGTGTKKVIYDSEASLSNIGMNDIVSSVECYGV